MKIDNQNEWLEFTKSAWDAAGRPKGLDPKNILTNPIEFDRDYYRYFQQKYIYLWHSQYSKIAPHSGLFIKKENSHYKAAWSKNFNWPTIWKQSLPLFVYGTTLGADVDVLTNLAAWYSIGQAVPSMVVDRILDNDTEIEMQKSDVAFSMLSYIKAIKGLRSMGLANTQKLENVFLNLTFEMYEKMFIEHCDRFKLHPGYISDAIRAYLSPNSRLLSTVFFSILPLWSYILTEEKTSVTNQTTILNKNMEDSFEKLRMVRQLNDEIVDVNEDIQHGLLTLPWLFAIEEKSGLKDLIHELWETNCDKVVLKKCTRILETSSGRERAMEQSLKMLSQSMRNVMNSFRVEKAFDICLLHNIRWTLLNRLELIKFKANTKFIVVPEIPQNNILESSKIIEPVPGGGLIVRNSSDDVLMTLVMKRGMLRWEIPAGMSKGPESLEETAKREFYEETGKEFDIEVGELIATCWHYSEMINKGWMGLFFKGFMKVKNNEQNDKLSVIKPEAFTHNKFNMYSNPELYENVNKEDYDFEHLLTLCNHYSPLTVHEIAIASGFVDWKKIPESRIHPLHRKLLENIEVSDKSVTFLYSNADEDFYKYDKNSKLYFNI